ncbi:Uncharacterised protein [Mycobacteroides abscessus subsp. abscessus]|nr:Uncharacterised protein [Mycobacteroides abscessus subsp. abscessus]
MNISQLMLIWQWQLIAMMLHMKVSLTSISNKLKKNVSTVKKSMIISTIVVNMLNLNQYQRLKLNLNLSLKHLKMD